MLKKTLVAAALTAISGAALAHPPHWAPAHGWRSHHAPVRYYAAPPVRYVVPRPVVVVPAPVYVAPRPAYVAPPPIYPIAPAISIRFHLPL